MASVREIISNAKSWCSDTLVHSHRLRKKNSATLNVNVSGCTLFQTAAKGKLVLLLTLLTDHVAEEM